MGIQKKAGVEVNTVEMSGHSAVLSCCCAEADLRGAASVATDAVQPADAAQEAESAHRPNVDVSTAAVQRQRPVPV